MYSNNGLLKKDELATAHAIEMPKLAFAPYVLLFEDPSRLFSNSSISF